MPATYKKARLGANWLHPSNRALFHRSSSALRVPCNSAKTSPSLVSSWPISCSKTLSQKETMPKIEGTTYMRSWQTWVISSFASTTMWNLLSRTSSLRKVLYGTGKVKMAKSVSVNCNRISFRQQRKKGTWSKSNWKVHRRLRMIKAWKARKSRIRHRKGRKRSQRSTYRASIRILWVAVPP